MACLRSLGFAFSFRLRSASGVRGFSGNLGIEKFSISLSKSNHVAQDLSIYIRISTMSTRGGDKIDPPEADHNSSIFNLHSSFPR